MSTSDDDFMIDAGHNVMRAVDYLLTTPKEQRPGSTVGDLKQRFRLSASGACTAIGIANVRRIEREDARRRAAEEERINRRRAEAEARLTGREVE